MKWLKRLHLYIGCFFTPLLMLFIITGFLLIYKGERQKGPDESTSLLQKLFFVHTSQFMPVNQPTITLTQLKAIDADANSITTFELHNYPDNTAVRLSTSIGTLPVGLDADSIYWTQSAEPHSFSLRGSKDGDVVEISGIGDTNVYIMPKVDSRPVSSYDPALFRWMTYFMVVGVVITMVLGIVLALKVSKDKRPVATAFALGILIPILFLKLGQEKVASEFEEADPFAPGTSLEPPVSGIPGTNSMLPTGGIDGGSIGGSIAPPEKEDD